MSYRDCATAYSTTLFLNLTILCYNAYIKVTSYLNHFFVHVETPKNSSEYELNTSVIAVSALLQSLTSPEKLEQTPDTQTLK